MLGYPVETLSKNYTPNSLSSRRPTFLDLPDDVLLEITGWIDLIGIVRLIQVREKVSHGVAD